MLLLCLLSYIVANASSNHQYLSYRSSNQSLGLLIGLPLFTPLLTTTKCKIELINGYLSVTSLSGMFIGLVVLVGLLTIIWPYEPAGDDSTIIMICTIGTLLLIIASSIITLILALEMQSFGGYLVVASCILLGKKVECNLTCGLIYFFLGSFASGIVVIGIGLLYIVSGQLNYIGLEGIVSDIWYSIGCVLILLGLGFKIGAAPLHFWVIYVYGSITNDKITFLSAVSKIGILVALYNLSSILGNSVVVWGLALISLVVGGLGGFNVREYRKLIVFSGINNLGFILILLLCGNGEIILYYLIQYSGTLFFCIIVRYDYALYIGLFSLAGIPPLVGFYAKLGVLESSLEEGYVILVLVALLSTLLTCYYYLRTILAIRRLGVEQGGLVVTNELAYVGSLIIIIIMVGIIVNT